MAHLAAHLCANQWNRVSWPPWGGCPLAVHQWAACGQSLCEKAPSELLQFSSTLSWILFFTHKCYSHTESLPIEHSLQYSMDLIRQSNLYLVWTLRIQMPIMVETRFEFRIIIYISTYIQIISYLLTFDVGSRRYNPLNDVRVELTSGNVISRNLPRVGYSFYSMSWDLHRPSTRPKVVWIPSDSGSYNVATAAAV